MVIELQSTFLHGHRIIFILCKAKVKKYKSTRVEDKQLNDQVENY